MKTTNIIPAIALLLGGIRGGCQNNALVINGGYVTLNGGTSTTPVYLVVNQPNALGITRTSGHIISEGDYNFVKWNIGSANANYVFPFGYSTTDYIPFTFNKTTGDANLAVSTYGTSNPNTPLANTVTNMNPSGPLSDASNMVVDRWWRIQVENGVSAPAADLTFSYRGSENTIAGIVCPADVLVAQYWNSPNWATPAFLPGSACVTAGVGTAQANGVSVFTTSSSHPFVLVKQNNLLPVELLSFIGKCENSHVKLSWQTASEQNSSHFEVQRNKEQETGEWETIGIIQGAGNSSTIKNYEFTDPLPEEVGWEGPLYYRLKQVDYDGKYEYYGPVSVNLAECSTNEPGITPTLNAGNFTILFNNEETLHDVIIYNSLGQIVFQKSYNGILAAIQLEQANGIYFVYIRNAKEHFTGKVVISR